MTPESQLPPSSPPPGGNNAIAQLNVPAILLIVTGAIGILSSLTRFVGGGNLPPEVMNDPQMAKYAGTKCCRRLIAIVAAQYHREMEQSHQCLHHGRHIRESGGSENPADAGTFLAVDKSQAK